MKNNLKFFLGLLIFQFVCLQVFAQSDLPKVSDAIRSVTNEMLQTGDRKTALQNFQKLLEFYPNSGAIRYNLGLISEGIEDWDGAERWFTEYINLKENTEFEKINQAKKEIEKIKRIKSQTPAERLQYNFKKSILKIRTLANVDLYDEAEKELNSIRDIYSDRYEFFEVSSEILILQGKNRDGMRALEKAISLAPEMEKVRLNAMLPTIANSQKTDTAYTDLKSKFDTLSKSEIINKSFDIWANSDNLRYQEISFALIYGISKGGNNPLVLDNRIILTSSGRCSASVISDTPSQFATVKNTIKFNGKSVHDLSDNEKFLDGFKSETNTLLLLNNKLWISKSGVKSTLPILESSKGHFLSDSKFYIFSPTQGTFLYTLQKDELNKIQLDDSLTPTNVVNFGDRTIVSNSSRIKIFDSQGKLQNDFEVPFQRILKIFVISDTSILTITDKSFTKIVITQDKFYPITLIVGEFSNQSTLISSNGVICTNNGDRYEVGYLYDLSIGNTESDRVVAKKQMNDALELAELKAYEKALIKILKVTERFPNSKARSVALTLKVKLTQ